MALAVLLAALTPARAWAGPGFTETCERALPKERVDDLIARMQEAATQGPCALFKLDTAMYRTQMEWRRGAERFSVLLGPRGCVLEPTLEGEELATAVPPGMENTCPQAVAAIEEFVGKPSPEQLQPVVRGQAPQTDTDAEGLGRWLAGLCWLAALGLGLAGAREYWRRVRWDPELWAAERAWVVAAVIMTGVALAVRFSVEASITNWYGGFLPAQGPGEVRFGASGAVLQAAVRAASDWSPGVAFGLVRVIGALAIPLVMVLVRRLGGSLLAATAAGVLLTFAPIAVRMSASSSEHVLAGTLALAAWTVWMGTASDGSRRPRVFALVLLLLAVLGRVDCWPQLVTIALWPVLVRARSGWLPLGRRLADAAFFGVVWAAIGIYGYFAIVVPSNHPGPAARSVAYTAKVLFSQLWVATIEPPHWLSPVTFVLLVTGIVAALLARRWGLVVAGLVTHTLIFIPLGRNMTHDGLTGARYFVFMLPLFAVLASALFDLIDARLRARGTNQRRTLSIALVVMLGIAAGVSARPGWTHRSTFQEEYGFLAEQLATEDVEECTLWFVRPRQPVSEPDLDCCLAPDRSPLGLVAPSVRFRPFRDAKDVPEDGCQLFYEGALCSIAPELAPENPDGLALIDERCGQLQRLADGAVLGEAVVTDQNLNERFHGSPRVTLYGWRR